MRCIKTLCLKIFDAEIDRRRFDRANGLVPVAQTTRCLGARSAQEVTG